MQQLRFRERIVPLQDERGKTVYAKWPKARELVARRGGLPPHILLDKHLCDAQYRQSLPPDQLKAIDAAFPLVSRDLCVHPAKGARFQLDRDVRDAKTGWLLRWSALIRNVPPAELTRLKTALLVTPRRLEPERYRGKKIFVVHPRSITVIHPAIEHYGQWGRVHAPTALVLGPRSSEPKHPEMDKKRRFWRFGHEAIMPLSRGTDWRWDVYADCDFSCESGVAYVVYDLLDEKGTALIEGIGLREIKKLAAGERPDILEALSRTQLEAAGRLAQKIDL